MNEELPLRQSGEIVTSTGLFQGPRAVFILCKEQRAYLPLLGADGKELMRHKGIFGDLQLEHNEDGTLKNTAN